jgi:putative ABC transport system ATP-binding protein
MGALDRPSSGVVNIHGSDISQMNEKALARLRNQTIGFVFQNFYLLPYYTALENVCLPLIYAGTYPEKKAAAQALLEQVGLGSRVHHKPNELSGGERQRVAIARSLINQPQILFADEPTGNLDSQNGESVMDILRQINTSGTTVILITHDPKIAGYAKRTLHVQDGEVS